MSGLSKVIKMILKLTHWQQKQRLDQNEQRLSILSFERSQVCKRGNMNFNNNNNSSNKNSDSNNSSNNIKSISNSNNNSNWLIR